MSGLDGLRAAAVLAVVAYHLNFGWAQGGLLGVGVFFVLSGYLITDLLLTQRERTGRIALGQFWVRRARRLLPALWVMLLVVALWVSVVQPAQLTALREDVIAAFAYASNWWYVFHHVSYFASFGPLSPLSHLWSLAVEEQFYLVWPLILIVAVRYVLRGKGLRRNVLGRNVLRRNVLLGLIVLAAAASAGAMAVMYQPGGDPNRVYYGTDTRAFELLIGAALAVALPSRRIAAFVSRRGRVALDVVGICGLAVIGLMVVYTTQYQPFIYQGGLVLLSVAAAGAIAALAHPSTLLSKVFGCTPLRWIGVRSYGIYLWHFPIIILTTPLVDSAGPHLVRSGLQVAATVCVAALSWRYVEQPIRRGALEALVARARAARWPLAGMPTNFGEAMSAAALAVAAAGAQVVGFAPAVQSAQAVPQLAVSVSLPSEYFSSAATTLCASGSGTSPAPTTSTASSSAAPHTAVTQTAPQASAATSTPPPTAPPTATPPVTAVGDSIMIDVAPFLHAMLPGATVDGKVSRQMYQLPHVVTTLKAENRLAHRLVIELGTDGPFSEDQLLAVLRSLGPMDRIVLVNTRVPRPWQNAVNQTLAHVAAQVPQSTVVDWYTASAGMPQYFWSDGVHPDPQGSRVLASLIARAVDPPRPGPVSPPATPAPAPSPPAIPANGHWFPCG